MILSSQTSIPLLVSASHTKLAGILELKGSICRNWIIYNFHFRIEAHFRQTINQHFQRFPGIGAIHQGLNLIGNLIRLAFLYRLLNRTNFWNPDLHLIHHVSWIFQSRFKLKQQLLMKNCTEKCCPFNRILPIFTLSSHFFSFIFLRVVSKNHLLIFALLVINSPFFSLQ